jgi:Rnl2 family RNA ligase
MRHLAYPKIPTADRFCGTNVNGPWVATEKIHGAQVVIAYDGQDLRVGKRKAWLLSDESFFGWQLLRGKFVQASKVALGRGSGVRIFGELYGGHYPHPAVSPAPGATAVQTGIWYSPDIRFALFDVLIHQDFDDPGEFQTYSDVAAIASESGLDVVPLLAKGTRAVVDAVPFRFVTRVPQTLGLPALPDNMAEGVVIRPDVAISLERRPIVKVKIEEFDEQRFDESRPWNPQTALTAEQLREVALGMVNAPRLASARSKVGPSDLDSLLDELTLDVMVDLSEAFPAAFNALSKTNQNAIEAEVRRSAAMSQGS